MASPAGLIVTNADVITMDSALPRVQAVAILGNKIAFVGSAEDVEKWRGSGTRMIDARGRTLLPGFIDSHYHMFIGSAELAHLLLDDIVTFDQLAIAIRDYALENPDLPWVTASHAAYSVMPVGRRLTRHDLDAILPDRPLAIMDYSYHTMWANTRALELAGMLHGGKPGAGAEIIMGADGLAQGELREAGAFAPLLSLIGAWGRSTYGYLYGRSPHPSALAQAQEQDRAILRKGFELASRYGITSIHNMDGNRYQLDLYAAMEDMGELTARINVPFMLRPETPVDSLDEAEAMQRDFNTEMVRSGRVKVFMDGIIESWTALMLEEYANKSGSVGGSLFSADHFAEMAVECDRRGLQIDVHAIGDAAVRRTLDGYEAAQRANGRRDSRHRIEHIETVHPDDILRFAEIGVIASMQPLHAPGMAVGPMDVWPEAVGEERWPYAFPWQTLRQAGARLVFGSDWPIVTQNPLLGLYAAVTRKPWKKNLPDQRQTLENAIASFTRDAAYAEFQEHVKGQLRVGCLADMVLLSADLEKISHEDIKDVTPALTICDGRIVFEALIE